MRIFIFLMLINFFRSQEIQLSSRYIFLHLSVYSIPIITSVVTSSILTLQFTIIHVSSLSFLPFHVLFLVLLLKNPYLVHCVHYHAICCLFPRNTYKIPLLGTRSHLLTLRLSGLQAKNSVKEIRFLSCSSVVVSEECEHSELSVCHLFFDLINVWS